MQVPAPAAPTSTGLSQTVSVPNGTHTFQCYLRAGSSGNTIEVGVDGHGDAYQKAVHTTTRWVQKSVTVNVTTGTMTV